MHLISLHLRNIRSYKDQTLHFPEGTVLLSGDIGAGKTTLLLAIEFALFGIKRGILESEGLLRHGTNEGFVEFLFEVDGKEILIHRSLKRTNKSIAQEAGYIIQDGLRYDGTAQELKHRIFDLLGYPKEFITKGDEMVYRYTVYTAQEEMKAILFADPQERLNILRRVFGIDKYKRIKENTSIYTKELRTQMREAQAILQEKPAIVAQALALKSQQEVTHAQIFQKEMSAKNLQMHQQAYDKRVQSVQQEFEASRVLKEAYSVITARIKEKVMFYNSLKTQIEDKTNEIQSQKEQLGEDIPVPQDPAPLEKQLAELRAKHLELKRLQAEYLTKQSTCIERLQRLNKEAVHLLQNAKELTAIQERLQAMVIPDPVSLEKEHAILVSSLEEATSHKRSVQLQIQHLTITLDKVHTLEKCPTCLQQVHSTHKEAIKEHTHNAIASLTSTLPAQDASLLEQRDALTQKITLARTLQTQYAVLSAKHDAMQNVKEELRANEQERIQLEAQLSSLCTTLENLPATLEQDVSKLENTLSSLRQSERAYTQRQNTLSQIALREQQLVQMQAQLKLCKAEHEQAVQERVQLGFSQERHASLSEEAITLQQKASALMQKLHEHQTVLASLRATHTSLVERERIIQERITSFVDKEQELSFTQQLEFWCAEWFMPLMDTMEKHVLTKVNREFNTLFTQWFDMLMQDSGMSVRIDDAFTPCIMQNGFEMQVNHLSGGEKTAVALAYRLALNKVVNTLVDTIATQDIIVLDEPTDGFSTQQLDRVKDVLEELHAKQTIIVSHDPKVESFVQSVIKITKTEHESVIE